MSRRPAPRRIRRPADVDPKRIVEVAWRDASGHQGWKGLDDLRAHEPEAIVSVGYLLAADRHRVLLVQSQDRRPTEHRQGSDTLAIPREWVQRVRTVGRRG